MESDSPPHRSSSRSARRSSRGPHEEEPSNFADDYDLEGGPVSGSQPPTPPARSVSFKKRQADADSPGLKTVGTEDTTLTIRHENKTSRSGAMMGLSKPVMALVGLITLGSLGAGLWGWLTIPGLYDQIEKLEHQVNRLSGQIDRLEGEVDRFERLNADLNVSIAELDAINQDLNATVNRLEDQVDQLEIVKDELEFQNDRYRELNDELNETADQLGAQVDRLFRSIHH